MEDINKNNLFDFDSNYAMALVYRTQFAGKHIPPRGGLFSTTSIRMQILIPQVNTESFYRLSVVDEFHIFSENNKLVIMHNPNDSVTLLLIKKDKDGEDDISKNAQILFPINSISSTNFILEKSITELDKDLNKNLLYCLSYDTKPDEKILNNLINKEELINFSQNIKANLNNFLDKVKSKSLQELIQEYDYIETYSLQGIIEAVQENDKIYEAKNNFDNLNIELNGNNQNNNKKIKL